MANGRCGVGGGGGLSVGDITLKDKSADENFLVCDGSQVSAANYPQLTALLPKKADASFSQKYAGTFSPSNVTTKARLGNAVVLAMNGEAVFASSDNGETWSTGQQLKNVTANNSAFFGAVFEEDIYKSTNGTAWNSVYSPSVFTKINGQIAAVDAGIVAFGANYHFVSTDNGASFVQASLGSTFNAACCCSGFGYVWFYNASEALVYRYSPGDEYPSSVDGGLSFTSSAKMVFVGEKVILYEGTQMRVRASVNSNFQSFTAPASIFGIVYTNNAFYISAGGKVYKTTDFSSFEELTLIFTSPYLYIESAQGVAIGAARTDTYYDRLGKIDLLPLYELPNLTADFVSTPYIKAK